ncbi:MAG: hypothetical protein LDLANPLL_00339 [Turneriella sp.]|nr:hypothetical protein [Turneriella sp.]
MCLIVLSYEQNADFPLVIAANRDEFYSRPSAPLSWWKDEPHLLAGRDLKEGGTWLGVNQSGFFAAVTNVRSPMEGASAPAATDGVFRGVRSPMEGASAPAATDGEEVKIFSRGILVRDFLLAKDIHAYIKNLEDTAHRYKGFNLIFGNPKEVFYFENKTGAATRKLSPGLYALSNHFLDTPWYKVQRAKEYFQRVEPSDSEAVLSLLHDTTVAPDSEVQQTGFPFAMEKMLSPIFIRAPMYGTRVSSHLFWSKEGVHFVERTFEEGKAAGDRSLYVNCGA